MQVHSFDDNGCAEGVELTAYRVHQLPRPARMVLGNLALQALIHPESVAWMPHSPDDLKLAYLLTEYLLIERIPNRSSYQLTAIAAKALGAMLIALLQSSDGVPGGDPNAHL